MVLLIYLAGSLLNALVIMSLWSWFVVPLGVASMEYWHAYGFGLWLSLIGLFTLPPDSALAMRGMPERDKVVVALVKVVASALILATGFAAHVLMGITQ